VSAAVPQLPRTSRLARLPAAPGVVGRVIRERPAAATGASLLLLMTVLALAAPLVAPHGIDERVGSPFAAPSFSHPLGLDDGGHDILSLLIWGARVSMLVGFSAALVSMLLGGLVGLLAGYFGGAVDGVLAMLIDYFLVVPVLPLMIVVAAIWGPSLDHIILIIGLLLWTTTARIIRAQVQSTRERVYVRRVRALGASHTRVIARHIVPQVAPLLVANTVLTIGVAIFAETALSFLGLGDPSATSWGRMIEDAFNGSAIAAGAWWAVAPAGFCVALVIVACSLLGGALEDSLNPRLRVAHLSRLSFRRLEPEDAA
jgi:peptide/nickel transport system permease protein